jgi:peptide/nickel transport system permease protein
VIRYIARRLVWGAVLFIAATIVTYAIFFVIPADPARLVAGKAATPQDIARARHFLGLDRPVAVQYGLFLKRLVVYGDLGTSFANRQSVNSIVFNAAPVTASLVAGGAILWMLIALPVGILSALRPRSPLDRIAMVTVLVGISAHPVSIGLILSYLLGYVPTTGHFLGLSFPSFTLLPIQGYCDLVNPEQGTCGGPVQWAYHLVLPWFAFAILYAALYGRMIRAGVMETMSEDYVRTARAKGASEWRVVRRHALPNALLPVVSMLGMDVALALGGAVFTETVFGLPGLGKTAIESLSAFDLPVTTGVVVFAATAVIVLNLLVDILYVYLDPRIRLD